MDRTVLVIEDNDQNRYLVTFLLERHGLRVTSEPDGPRGIETARSLCPDLILLDIQLPGMSGYDVARKLRKLPDFAAIPIVAVTSYAMPGDREAAMDAGCSGYIEKPIDPDTFVDEVTGYLPDASPETSGS